MLWHTVKQILSKLILKDIYPNKKGNKLCKLNHSVSVYITEKVELRIKIPIEKIAIHNLICRFIRSLIPRFQYWINSIELDPMVLCQRQTQKTLRCNFQVHAQYKNMVYGRFGREDFGFLMPSKIDIYSQATIINAQAAGISTIGIFLQTFKVAFTLSLNARLGSL